MTPRTVVFSLPAHFSVPMPEPLKIFGIIHAFPSTDNDDPEDIVGIVMRRAVLETVPTTAMIRASMKLCVRCVSWSKL